MPAGIGRRGRIARASPMDEVGSMPTSSIKSTEHVTTESAVCGTTWAGTALTNFRPLPLVDCPVDSRATDAAQCLCSLFAGIRSRWRVATDWMHRCVHAFGAQPVNCCQSTVTQSQLRVSTSQRTDKSPEDSLYDSPPGRIQLYFRTRTVLLDNSRLFYCFINLL